MFKSLFRALFGIKQPVRYVPEARPESRAEMRNAEQAWLDSLSR